MYLCIHTYTFAVCVRAVMCVQKVVKRLGFYIYKHVYMYLYIYKHTYVYMYINTCVCRRLWTNYDYIYVNMCEQNVVGKL